MRIVANHLHHASFQWRQAHAKDISSQAQKSNVHVSLHAIQVVGMVIMTCLSSAETDSPLNIIMHVALHLPDLWSMQNIWRGAGSLSWRGAAGHPSVL